MKIEEKEIKRLYKNGLSYRRIAEKYDTSFQRIHQIVTGYKSPRKTRKSSFDILSGHIINYLLIHPEHTKLMMDFMRFVKKSESKK